MSEFDGQQHVHREDEHEQDHVLDDQNEPEQVSISTLIFHHFVHFVRSFDRFATAVSSTVEAVSGIYKCGAVSDGRGGGGDRLDLKVEQIRKVEEEADDDEETQNEHGGTVGDGHERRGAIEVATYATPGAVAAVEHAADGGADDRVTTRRRHRG